MSTYNEKHILAIDLGTSGPKAALVTAGGDVVDYEFQEVELVLLPGGGAEQKPVQTSKMVEIDRGRTHPFG
ncbi:MAG: hypothetical protein PVI13_07965 [Desulfobacterales bacterium]|jgi:xylulokinase